MINGLLTRTDLAEITGQTEKTLSVLHANPRRIAPEVTVREGDPRRGRPLYSVEAIDKWLEARRAQWNASKPREAALNQRWEDFKAAHGLGEAGASPSPD